MFFVIARAFQGRSGSQKVQAPPVVVDDDETETEDEEEVKVKLETSDSLLDKYTSKQLPEFWYVRDGSC